MEVERNDEWREGQTEEMEKLNKRGRNICSFRCHDDWVWAASARLKPDRLSYLDK